MKPALPILAALLALGPAASAQTCGPLAFSFTSTGPGCFPGAPGLGFPTLGATLVPPAVPGTCAVQFSTPIALASLFLAIGTSNPMLDLGPFGFAGCVLSASPQIIVPFGGASGFFLTLNVPVPQDPALVGATAYTQAFLLSGGTLALSNGIRVDLL